jgi:hypothetical protein
MPDRLFLQTIVNRSYEIFHLHYPLFRNVLLFIQTPIVIFSIYWILKLLSLKSNISRNSTRLLSRIFKYRFWMNWMFFFRRIYTVTSYLTSSDIAHNMSIVKGDSLSSSSESALRIFIWFRQSNIGKFFSKNQ